MKPTEVTLVLGDGELRAEQAVYSARGSSVRTAFTIPLTTIIAVGASLPGESGGLVPTGRFGVSSSLNHEEYVTLTLQSGDRIDAVVFKVARQQSAEIAAKIESAAEKAQETPSSRPAKARKVRPHRPPSRLVKVVGRTSPPPRDGSRKGRGRWRGAANHRDLKRT